MIYTVLLAWIKGLFGRSVGMRQDSLAKWDLLPYSFKVDWYVSVRKDAHVSKVTEDPPANYGGTE